MAAGFEEPPVRAHASLRLVLGVAAALLAWGCGPTYPGLPGDGSPGTFQASFQHDGVRRTAIVYVPESIADVEAAPMLLSFHGYGGSAAKFMDEADLRPEADDDGFVLVYPQGTRLDGFAHWNSAAPSDGKADGVIACERHSDKRWTARP